MAQQQHETPSYVRLAFQLDVIVLVMVMILVLDSIALVHIYKISGNSARHTIHVKAMRRLAVYPLVYFILWLPVIINRDQNVADPDHPSFRLYLFQAMINPLQGALNAIVYGVNEKFLEMYQQCLRRMWLGNYNESSSSMELSNSHTKVVAIQEIPQSESKI